ncbi:MAG: winged helix-turn-helix transcriptional regulator [Bacillota bacterium]
MPLIIDHLAYRDRRDFQVQRIAQVTTRSANKGLSHQLKELEEDGFINRTQYDTIPPKVGYP